MGTVTYEWQCANPKCQAVYAEYSNGCPKCCTGEVGGSWKVIRRRKGKAIDGLKFHCEDCNIDFVLLYKTKDSLIKKHYVAYCPLCLKQILIKKGEDSQLEVEAK